MKELADELGVDLVVKMEEFSDPADAPPAFRGSPTILIQGLDLDPAARNPAPGPIG